VFSTADNGTTANAIQTASVFCENTEIEPLDRLKTQSAKLDMRLSRDLDGV